MDFNKVFKLLIESFQKGKINFAVIGGFALHASGVTRTTQDIDFIINKDDLGKVKKILFSYGYELIHESQDVANFAGKMLELGRVDFLLAYRKYAKTFLARAQAKEILNGEFKIKIVKTEDLIGLKVQSSSNDPARYHQDMADIVSLIRTNFKKIDMKLVREYFALFNREEELKQILEKIKDA